jgi:UDP-3-O-acyl N-acetylglucosamine deacetylase
MNKARVLIVDDQEEILESLAAILADEGYEAIKARDGQEALHVVQSDSPDVVFLDIWIPGIDGMQTLKAIKRIAPDCSVIMMSGHGTIETAVKAIKLGATDYLEKPLNLEDVLHLAHKAVSRSSVSTRSSDDNGIVPQLIGISAKADGLRRSLELAAKEPGTVWLSGDKGTGKEFLARIIHRLAGKDRNTLVKVQCTDLSESNIAEVMLGGGNRSNARPGKLRQAEAGTLLLLRVDRLAKAAGSPFSKIIREHLQQSGSHSKSASRIVSTSTVGPEALTQSEGFPRELADILSQRIIHIPSLQERSEDIPLYVEHFLKEAVAEFDRDIIGTDDEALARLLEYPWPGNVKELKILIEHVVMTAPGPRITAADLLIPWDKLADAESAKEDAQVGPPRAHFAGEPAGPSSVISVVNSEEASPPETHVPGPIRNQKTLRGKVVMYGQGLHSGNKTGLTISPMPPSAGILFGHITAAGTVPAILSHVQSTELSTSLKREGLIARTIEHLMAVFHVYGLTNVLVKISGEVPIMDGSALEFCNLVESAEIIIQDEPIEEIQISEPLELPLDPGGPKSLKVEPSDRLEVEYFLDYPSPIGKMHMIYRCEGPEQFKQQIAPARTFGFVRDMRMMDEMGLAGGGRLSNVILLDEEKVVNPPLRFADEFVRHKILDIIGDFYLLGRPFCAKITAKQTGHTENIAMLRLINEKMKIL